MSQRKKYKSMKRKTKKLKVDVVNRYYYPVVAGIETLLTNVYPHLACKGWDVTIHVSKNTLSQKKILKDEEEINKVKVKRYYLGLFGFSPKIDWQNTSIVNIFNFDVFPHVRILLYCLILKYLGMKKFTLILSPQGGFTPEWSLFKPLSRVLKRIYHYTMGTYLINQVVDLVVAVSTWEKLELERKGVMKPQIVILPNGIEAEAYKNVDMLVSKHIEKKLTKIGKYIIQVGRIHPIKNYECSIKAVSKLPNSIKLVLVGPVVDSVYKRRISSLIKQLGLEDIIIFLGMVSNIDKYFLMKHAQMMIHTSLNESFCHVVNEAMSQGQICVVSDNSALPYLIEGGVNGYLVETHNYQGFANKISYVMEHSKSEIIRKMRNQNRKHALRYSWVNIGNKVDHLYRSSI